MRSCIQYTGYAAGSLAEIGLYPSAACAPLGQTHRCGAAAGCGDILVRADLSNPVPWCLPWPRVAGIGVKHPVSDLAPAAPVQVPSVECRGTLRPCRVRRLERWDPGGAGRRVPGPRCRVLEALNTKQVSGCPLGKTGCTKWEPGVWCEGTRGVVREARVWCEEPNTSRVPYVALSAPLRPLAALLHGVYAGDALCVRSSLRASGRLHAVGSWCFRPSVSTRSWSSLVRCCHWMSPALVPPSEGTIRLR